MKTHYVAKGISSFNWENAHVGNYKTECLCLQWIMMHTQEVLQNNPFNFKQFSASQMAIYLNWDVSVPSLELNFVDKQ